VTLLLACVGRVVVVRRIRTWDAPYRGAGEHVLTESVLAEVCDVIEFELMTCVSNV